MNNLNTTNIDLATSLLHTAIHEGGVTYWTTITAPSEGYTVGIDKHTETIDSEYPDAVYKVQDFITKHYLDGAGIGLWVDQDTLLLYLDVVIVFTDKSQALRFAAEQSQIAIYDIGNKEVIDVDYGVQL